MNVLPPVDTPLSEAEAEAAFGAMLDGAIADDADIAAFLVALSDRGETAGEIAGAARAMRARMVPVRAPEGAIDVCGTGGDGHHTLNVSTAVSLVVAACEVPVAKHGNRAASSKAGAADTLEALGLNLDRAAETAEQTLHDLGICFLFAAKHHPAMGRIMPIRKALGRRTIFNLMGPLANPAGVTRQLVGIARPAYVPIYAEALHRLGSERSFVVSGDEGLDELSLAGGNELAIVTREGVQMGRVAPSDAGLPGAAVSAIRGGDAAFNANALRGLLMGEPGPYRDAVLFNAAAALQVAGAAAHWHEGVEEAAEAIDKGLAKALLDCWIAMLS
ncbi:anthranilate phosphoribosyltransferase [Novosphingobium sp. ZN18A2]|uniref:anthranilate phosphoribosyltransferase n=1 Tax=Novosphingobium sp. ZN18A2 TaxID=3079861 RepID=UPI0030D4EB29